MKPGNETDTTDSGNAAVNINLQQYSINNTNIRYDDEQGNMHLKIAGLDHS